MKITSKQTLRQLIRRSFIVPTVVSLLVIVCLGVLFVSQSLKTVRLQNASQSHQILARLLRPSLLISDTANLTRVLGLTQKPREVLVLINRSGDLITANNSNLALANALIPTQSLLGECPDKAYFSAVYQGQVYRVFCTKISQQKELNNDSTATVLGLLWSFDREQNFSLSAALSVVLLFIIVLIIAVLAAWIYIRLKKLLFDPFDRFKGYVLGGHFEQGEFSQQEPLESAELQEVFELRQLFEVFVKRIRHNVETEKQAALGSVALQVAHDIRSPLAVMNIVLEQLGDLPPKQKRLLSNASERINAIANDMLQRYKIENVSQFPTVSSEKVCTTSLLANAVETIVSEKNVQWQSSTVTLCMKLSQSARLAFVAFEPNEMKRLLSNLLNNAYESLPAEKGQIEVSLDVQNDFLCLLVKDNGCGIAQEKLDAVIRPGVTTKEKGMGLGLPHANAAIQRWGGRFSLKSALGIGTRILIELPLLPRPEVYLFELKLSQTDQVLILDDDELIHQAWDERLKTLVPACDVHHFTQIDSFKAFYRCVEPANVVVLSDYDLKAEETGLAVLSALSPKPKQAVLVSSHCDNASLKVACENELIPILPKSILPYIHITISEVS